MLYLCVLYIYKFQNLDTDSLWATLPHLRCLDLVRNLTVEQKIIPIYEYFKLQHKEYFFNVCSLGCYIDRLKNRYSFL